MRDETYYRLKMVETQLTSRGISDTRVLEVMRSVPRHRFISGYSLAEAYSDQPLPIASGQTISQPYIVALMCELCELKGGEQVLEIGTGSAYQTVILSLLAKEVYSVERIGSLYSSARQLIEKYGNPNVSLIYGDGYEGYSAKAPYDAIIVSAAPNTVPPLLKEQLANGGTLVAPVGGGHQHLKVIKKNGNVFSERTWGSVRFVPMLKGKD